MRRYIRRLASMSRRRHRSAQETSVVTANIREHSRRHPPRARVG